MRMFHKTCDDAKFQYDWLCDLPSAHRPSILKYDGTLNKLSMEHLNLLQPVHWRNVWATARTVLWAANSDQLPCQIGEYIQYCSRRLNCLKSSERKWAEMAILELVKHRLTPVAKVHGDLTLENCFEVNGCQILFIDPGHTRGLNCKEIDEAKILQSLDGWSWHRHQRILEPDALSTFSPRRVHWCLLVTHYLRILRHEHPALALDFAHRRINEITEMLYGTP